MESSFALMTFWLGSTNEKIFLIHYDNFFWELALYIATYPALVNYRVQINVLLLRQAFQVYFQGIESHREGTG